MRDYLVDGEEAWPYERMLAGAEPFYWEGMTSLPGMGGLRLGAWPVALTRDNLPAGEVELQRGEPAHATDGPLGEVSGMVLDRDDRHVSHVLVTSGHLHGRHAAVPIANVTRLDHGVSIGLTRAEIRRLPPVTAELLR